MESSSATYVDSLRSWIVAIGAFITVLLVNGSLKSLGVMLPEIQKEFAGTNTGVIGLTLTLGHGFGAMLCKLRHPQYTVIKTTIKLSMDVTLVSFELVGSAYISIYTA